MPKFKLVDFQNVYKENSWYQVFGFINTEDNQLYYYKEKEMLKAFTERELSAFGVKKHKSTGSYSHRTSYDLTITVIDGLGFLSADDMRPYTSMTSRFFIDGKPVTDYINPYSLETIFTKPMRIARFTSGMTLWYKGLRFEYKAAYKNQTDEGFRLCCTLPWKTTKHYFYVNKAMTLLTPNVINDWPQIMTEDYFRNALNDFQNYYKVTTMYRSLLPFCKAITLDGIKTDDITSLREMFKNNNSLVTIDMGRYNLGKCKDFYLLFYQSKNVKIVDFSNCRGDLLLTDVSLTKDALCGCYLLNKNQIQFAAYCKNSGRTFIGTFKNLKDLEQQIQKTTINTELLTGKKVKGYFALVE